MDDQTQTFPMISPCYDDGIRQTMQGMDRWDDETCAYPQMYIAPRAGIDYQQMFTPTQYVESKPSCGDETVTLENLSRLMSAEVPQELTRQRHYKPRHRNIQAAKEFMFWVLMLAGIVIMASAISLSIVMAHIEFSS